MLYFKFIIITILLIYSHYLAKYLINLSLLHMYENLVKTLT